MSRCIGLAIVLLLTCARVAMSQPATPVSDYGTVTYLKVSNPDEDDRLGAGDPLMGLTVAISRDGSTLAAAAPHEGSAARGVNGDQADNGGFDTGAVYVFTRQGGRWTQQAYLKASNTGDWDVFGFSLALSADGNTLAVSAPREDSNARGMDGNQADNSAEESGAVYVFVRANGTWSQQAYVKASNTDAGDQFGFSLALSGDGNTLAVGAEGEGSSATTINGDQTINAGLEFGAAYVFTRTGSRWSQQAYTKAANAEAADRFGFCLALSHDGDSLAVCGYDEDSGSRGINGNQADNSANGSGAAYLFVRRGTTWTQDTYFKASNAVNADAFGSAIAISGDGNTIAVCAADEDVLSAGIDGQQEHKQASDHSAGAVFVFGKTGGTWRQQAYVKSSNIRADDVFGLRLALSDDGNVLAAGAPLQGGGGRGFNATQDDFSSPESGAVYLLRREAGRWLQSAYLKAPNADAYDQFGSALALSGDGRTLAVGAMGESSAAKGVNGNQADNSLRASGAVYVYESR